MKRPALLPRQKLHRDVSMALNEAKARMSEGNHLAAATLLREAADRLQAAHAADLEALKSIGA